MAAAGLQPEGVVRWGELINSDEPGIYVVSLARDAHDVGSDPRPAPIDLGAASTLLELRPELMLDGSRPTVDELAQRIAEFWLEDEHILYIGLAADLHNRVNQYYGTPLGARRPHSGGWFLKTITGLDQVFVHWALTYDQLAAERAALGAFVSSVEPHTLEQLRDPERPFPFANMEWPAGTRKRHGITGAKAPRVRLRGTESRGSLTSAAPHKGETPLQKTRMSRVTAETSQRVTATDLAAGRIRIPHGTKRLFPSEPARLRLRLRGADVFARWNPRWGPGKRSGVLSVGRDALSAVRPDEVLSVRKENDLYLLS